VNLAHLRTLVWLRSRLSRNQFVRGKAWVGVVSILLQVLLAIGAVVLAAGGFLAGLLVLDDTPRWVLWALWGGMLAVFLFFWMISVLSEVQRSESIDVRRLLHLPVSLRQVFVMNYLASLYTPSLVLAVPLSGALALGLVLGRGGHMAWLFPVLAAFFFALSAWTYCLRGWLVNLMVNKRRRRAILMGMTAAVVLMAQLPNIVFNSPFSRKLIRDRTHTAAQAAAPSADAAADVEVRPAAAHARGGFVSVLQVVPLWQLALPLAVCGMALGGLGLHRAYRVTVGFYTAETSSRRTRRKPPAPPDRSPSVPLVQRRLPWASEQVSALATALLRSSLRAPEMRMALLMPVVMALVFGLMLFRSSGSGLPGNFRPLAALGVTAMSALMMSQFTFNMFGLDRDAFRALVLAPAGGRQVLLAKNLALLPFPLAVGTVLILIVAVVLRLSPLAYLASMLQLVSVCLLLCVPGNFASTRVPFRLPAAGMGKPKVPGHTVLIILLCQLTIPVILVPAALPPLLGIALSFVSPLAGHVLNLVGSAGVFLVAVLVYRLVLPSAGRYFDGRAVDILKTVTSEVE
jgi:hypothetical protein